MSTDLTDYVSYGTTPRLEEERGYRITAVCTLSVCETLKSGSGFTISSTPISPRTKTDWSFFCLITIPKEPRNLLTQGMYGFGLGLPVPKKFASCIGVHFFISISGLSLSQ